MRLLSLSGAMLIGLATIVSAAEKPAPKLNLEEQAYALERREINVKQCKDKEKFYRSLDVTKPLKEQNKLIRQFNNQQKKEMKTFSTKHAKVIKKYRKRK